jgi:hypothetical protein
MKKEHLPVKYRFHHLGIPSEVQRPNEKYSKKFKMFTSDNDGKFRIQFHRFQENSPLHPLIKSLPHVALQVNDLAGAIKGCEVILGPYEPVKGYKVAFINDNGVPVELVETGLSEEELWELSRKQVDLNTEGL